MLEISISQQELEVFFLILVRMASFVSISPFFGETNVPVKFKLGFAIAMSYLIYLLKPDLVVEYNTTLEYATMVVKESIVGLLIGFSAFICNTIVLFSGRIVDMDIGLSMASMFDPTTKEQITLTGGFYQRVFSVLFMLSGMHVFLLGAMVDTFTLIPIGGLSVNLVLYGSLISFLSDYFIIGFRIIFPIVTVTLVSNCAMGIMTKIAPQIHMFSVGIQFKILVGLLILFMTVALLPALSDVVFTEMRSMVKEVIEGLS